MSGLDVFVDNKHPHGRKDGSDVSDIKELVMCPCCKSEYGDYTAQGKADMESGYICLSCLFQVETCCDHVDKYLSNISHALRNDIRERSCKLKSEAKSHKLSDVRELNAKQKKHVDFSGYQLMGNVVDNNLPWVHKGNGSTMRLIGIAGQARAGKDTLASHILCNLGGDWSRSSFADPLKEMLTAIGVDCSDDAKAVVDDSYGVTPRHMMQTLGTEWGRHMIDGDIWVKAFARLNAGKCVIVPDVRFENEAALVREHGVLIHLVGRGGIEGNHVSETPIAFKPGDIVIDNSRDLTWLHAQVDGNAVLGEFVSAE